MGLNFITMEKQVNFYPTLTAEERDRMHPWRKARCVMMSGDSPVFNTRPSRHPSIDCDLPEEIQPGHITPLYHLVNDSNDENHHHLHVEAEDLMQDEIIKEQEWDKLSSASEKDIPDSALHSKSEKNTHNHTNKVKDKTHGDSNDDDMCVNCIYIAQQFCECTIL